jgi:hypothetical protein
MHQQDFERRADRFIHNNPYTVVRNDDVEAGKRLWIVQINKRPPLVRWGALIGECLFNFRSALDHFAYDLALAGNNGLPLSPQAEKDSEFPIFHTRAPTKGELDRKIGCVHPKARDLIERMQPYGRKDRAALKRLDVLHNYDKHRTLHLVEDVAGAVSYFGEPPFDFLNFRPFKNGDVLASGPITSDPERQHDPSFTFRVAFSEAGPGAGAPDVGWTLRWIRQHIEDRVITPLMPFL